MEKEQKRRVYFRSDEPKGENELEPERLQNAEFPLPGEPSPELRKIIFPDDHGLRLCLRVALA